MKWAWLAEFLIILGFLNWIRPIFADIFEECNGVADESFVASQSNCTAYIYCDGGDSLLGYCDDGQYFDGETCDDKDNVYCLLDNELVTQEAENDGINITTTTTTAATTTASITSTTAAETTTTTTMLITAITPPIESNATTPIEALTIPAIVKDTCPVSDDPNQLILMANSQSCTEFYLCYHGHAIEMHCTDHLHFNADTGKCDFAENVHCQNNRPYANKCSPHITDFFPHPEKCNYFYYCIKGFMTIQQCPFYYGWDIDKRSCVHISQAKCFDGAKKSFQLQ